MEWHKLTDRTGYVSIGNAFVPGYFLTEDELVLIDSGPMKSTRLMEMLDERHWKARAVILTHVHIDHVANNALLLEKVPGYCFLRITGRS
ncbi:MAG: MBL fold metallo-hydrolase [Coprococcus sp.]